MYRITSHHLLFVLTLFTLTVFGVFFADIGVASWVSNVVHNVYKETTLLVCRLFLFSLFAIFGSLLLCKIGKKSLLPPVSLLWKILLLSALVTVLYNHYIFSHSHLICISVFSIASILMFSYAVLRGFFFLIWMPLFIYSCIQIGCFYRFGTTMNAFMLQETLHASMAEVANFLTFQNVSLSLLALLMSVFVIYLLHRNLRRISSPTLLFLGSNSLFLFCLSCMLVPPGSVHICSFWPAYELYRTKLMLSQAQEQEAALLRCVQHLKSPAEQVSSLDTIKPNQGVVCIVHIGESVRSDRLGINGWKNNTTPRLSKRSELINYRNCISFAPSTCSAFISLLTDATDDVQVTKDPQHQPKTGNVLDLLVTNSFTPAAFVHSSNVSLDLSEKMTKKSCEHTFSFIFEKLVAKFSHIESIGGVSMEQSEQIIRYCNENKQKNLVLLVNNIGSHGPFADYDRAHPVFSPSDPVSFYANAADNAEAVNNAYDNTIEYLDKFIGTVCDALEGRPFVYIYISDHGEYLGEDNMWTRGALKNYNDYRFSQACIVPFVIAYSPEFENLHPHINAALGH